MAGTSGSILFADNIDFSGGYPIQGEINLNGELLVGSTVAPNIRPYVPTGSNGLVVNTGNGTIDFTLANIPNAALANNNITVVAGTGLSGGGPAALGSSTTLNLSTPVSVANGGTGLTSAGSNGNVLTSNGTNWVSQAPASSSPVTLVTMSLTNTQIKNLHGTPVQVIAAPGAGKIIVIVQTMGKFIYGGTNAFTAAAGQTISLYYGTANPAVGTTSVNQNIFSNGLITGTASVYSGQMGFIAASTYTGLAIASMENNAINLFNPVSTEIGGNAANNNTMDFSVLYYVTTL